jgi:hypothetical protein
VSHGPSNTDEPTIDRKILLISKNRIGESYVFPNTFLLEKSERHNMAITIPTQLLKKSRHELMRPVICDWASSAAAEDENEMKTAQRRDNAGIRNKRAKKKGMKSRKFRKTSAGPVR